jgi:hypothetical protein
VISVEDDQKGADARGEMLESIIGENIRPQHSRAVPDSHLILLSLVAAIERREIKI